MTLDFLTGCFGWRPSKLSRCHEKTTRTWLWSLKLILIIPSAIGAFAARDSWQTIKRHPELSQWPYNEKTELAFFLTYVGSIVIFSWLFISSALLAKWRGPWILLYGLIDFGLAITVAIGVGMQAEFLPATFKGCDGNKADNWQRVNGHNSFFAAVANLYEDDKQTPKGICRSFLSDWTVTLAVLFFQMVASYIGIFFDEREFSILNPMRPLVWVILIIVGPPILVHDLLFPRIRIYFSYVKKWKNRSKAKKDLKIPEPVTFRAPDRDFDSPETKLTHVLVIEHVLLNIVDHSHYEDIINLSLTCRAVRETVFPPRDLEHRVPKLKTRCCETSTKTGCLYCNKKICFRCKSQRFLPGLPGRRHVSSCQPYCRACFYKFFSRHPRGYKRPCKCHTTDRSHEFQDMCRTCACQNPTQLQTLRHKRYQQQARDIAHGVGLQEGEKVCCGSCKSELKAGTRWWVCGKCKGECRDAIHPPYIGKSKESDVEKAETGRREGDEIREPWWRRWTGL